MFNIEISSKEGGIEETLHWIECVLYIVKEIRETFWFAYTYFGSLTLPLSVKNTVGHLQLNLHLEWKQQKQYKG